MRQIASLKLQRSKYKFASPSCEEVEAKEVQNEGIMPGTIEKKEVTIDLDHEPENNILSKYRHDTKIKEDNDTAHPELGTWELESQEGHIDGTKIIIEALGPCHGMTQEKDEENVGIDEGDKFQMNKDEDKRDK